MTKKELVKELEKKEYKYKGTDDSVYGYPLACQFSKKYYSCIEKVNFDEEFLQLGWYEDDLSDSSALYTKFTIPFKHFLKEINKNRHFKKENKQKSDSKEAVISVVQEQIKKGYRINEFELYMEKENNNLYFAAFGNIKEEPSGFGYGDTEKYVHKNNKLSQKVEKDAVDITENGEVIDHIKIYENHLEKKVSNQSKLKQIRTNSKINFFKKSKPKEQTM